MNERTVDRVPRRGTLVAVWLVLLALVALPLPAAEARSGSATGVHQTLAYASGDCSGDGVYLYGQANYEGRCRKWTQSDRNLTDDDFNDRASSIRFVGSFGGGRYTAILYEHPREGGAWSAFGANDPDLGNDSIGHDRASSIRLVPVPQCTGDGVYLYEHKDYAGRCRKFTASDANLLDTGFNDLVSSIKFAGAFGGGRYKVKLCEHAGYEGTCSVFTVNDPNLRDEVIRHDRTSSVLVEKVTPKLCTPTSGTITKRFEQTRALSIAGGREPGAQKVYAAHGGTVVYVGSTQAGCDRSYAVAITRDNTIGGQHVMTLYGHLGHWDGQRFTSYVKVRVGDRVSKGQLIGYQGDAPAGICGNGGAPVELQFTVYEKQKPFLDRYTSWGKRCERTDLFFETGGKTASCSLKHTARAVNPEAPYYLGALGEKVTQTCK